VSNLQTPVKGEEAREIFIAEFGYLGKEHLEPGRQYSGHLYKLTAESVRELCEALSFNARFDLLAIRNAYIDLFKNQGWIRLEIDRNTKPADISVRYSRNQWQVQEVLSKGPEGLRPWITSVYTARSLEEPAMLSVARLLNIAIDDLSNIYVRLNLKERTAALIADAETSTRLPDGASASFPIEQSQLPDHTNAKSDQLVFRDQSQDTASGGTQALQQPQVENVNQMSDQPQLTVEQKSSAAPRFTPAPGGTGEAKYATYSKSEVDYMLKQQAESIMTALSGKISAQQRAFQEAVAAQEKAFNKLSDTYLSQFEASRVKLETTAKSVHDHTKTELDEFHKLLSKELEQHRTQINKTVLPVAKALEGKSLPQPKENSAKQAVTAPAKAQQAISASQNKLEKLITFTMVLSLISAIVSAMALLQRMH
jgi:hypothetical protein